MAPTEVKVTRNGQVSLPAELRHRWHAGTVLVVDRGGYAIVRPVPADPITALHSAYAGPGLAAEAARAEERAAEASREQQRQDHR